MLNNSCRSFNLMFRVPDTKVDEVLSIFKSHANWMQETHTGASEPHPIVYIISKASELENPLDSPNDPKASYTGFTYISLAEIYHGIEGCEAHLEYTSKWKDFHKYYSKVISQYLVGSIMSGELIESMGGESTMNINKNCRVFNYMFRVPNEKVSGVESIFNSHSKWMHKTHKGPGEPHPLVYAINKSQEQNDLFDASKGFTGFTNISLLEIYKGSEGCEAHLRDNSQWVDHNKFVKEVLTPYKIGLITIGEVVETIHPNEQGLMKKKAS